MNLNSQIYISPFILDVHVSEEETILMFLDTGQTLTSKGEIIIIWLYFMYIKYTYIFYIKYTAKHMDHSPYNNTVNICIDNEVSEKN
jgi:hypothetical protein